MGKFAPFGFFVHGAVDGFSRRILGLEVNSTNKNIRVIASNYLNVVQQLGGVSRRMCCDRETENTIIGTLQQFFRWYDDDYFAGSGSFIEGKSTENQRIQAWWSKFWEGGGGWWINLRKDLHDCGLYHDDYLATECLRLIDTGNRGWKADVMFFTPGNLWNTQLLDKCGRRGRNSVQRNVCWELCVEHSEGLEELVRLIKPDYSPPSTGRKAL